MKTAICIYARFEGCGLPDSHPPELAVAPHVRTEDVTLKPFKVILWTTCMYSHSMLIAHERNSLGISSSGKGVYKGACANARPLV
jgi:hypothetical protein